jgi:hypothetical protein
VQAEQQATLDAAIFAAQQAATTAAEAKAATQLEAAAQREAALQAKAAAATAALQHELESARHETAQLKAAAEREARRRLESKTKLTPEKGEAQSVIGCNSAEVADDTDEDDMGNGTGDESDQDQMKCGVGDESYQDEADVIISGVSGTAPWCNGERAIANGAKALGGARAIPWPRPRRKRYACPYDNGMRFGEWRPPVESNRCCACTSTHFCDCCQKITVCLLQH